ncbi:MAG: hypothetical protein US68_C0014G0008 [Candidatus Shapirobacteria bacterium GW2011_GWE1_38_10]|uniref:Uncharacterized protein n=1 Tax=Candidatus Shapirobacteria bacterium GW2011_GWE1_38_10 TaxID=1618488 RepID=A0A0G0IER2_9BACT|nr:MAG: hypothetical protein US68_C0014G0008 [Candidatus Shapirobacteria bacterium GW2011_GWE1_38_10]
MELIDTLRNRNNRTARPTDYIQLAQNIVDDYDHGVVHGLQKDAIQNGWDAITLTKPTPEYVANKWSFIFELIEQQDKVLLSMTDTGTVGLTGKHTAKDNIPQSQLRQDERWARFESMAFNKNDSSGLGARGMGKMIFIHSSEDKCIFYDSLRQDGTYRAGYTIAMETECPVWNEDGEKGKKLISDTLGLPALNKTGTRVIIVNPTKDVITAIKSGDFKDFIEETWWPIIHKYGASIYIKHSNQTCKAAVPSIFPIDEDSENALIKSDLKFSYAGKVYNIKRLHIAYLKDTEIPDLHKGVACFRKGMKVDSMGPFIATDGLYGFAEFDKEVDKLLYDVERPSHYGFRSNTGIWNPLSKALKAEITEFEKEVLGIRLKKEAEEHRKRNEIDRIAFSILRDLTRGWNLLSNSPSGVNPPPTGTMPLKPVEIGLSIHNLNFPNEQNIPRLNFGDIVSDFSCDVYNDSEKKDIKADVKIIVVSGNREITKILEAAFDLNSGDRKSFNNLSLVIDPSDFTEAGEYKLRAILRDSESKEVLHKITRSFWVEMEPPLRSPFNVEWYDFTTNPNKDIHKLSWLLQPEGDSKYTCYINIEHSQYKKNADSEEDLSLYEAQIFFEAAVQMLLSRIDSDLSLTGFVGPFNVEKIRNGDLSELYSEYIRAVSEAKFEIFKR